MRSTSEAPRRLNVTSPQHLTLLVGREAERAVL
jgi:hypothetical protein